MKFRGTTPEGKVVEGYYVRSFHGQHIILPKEGCCRLSGNNFHGAGVEVLPSSLAMSTTIFDKNETEIFGSFEYEPGKMSEGGDNVRANNFKVSVGKVIWNRGAFVFGGDKPGLAGTELRQWNILEVLPKLEKENG